MSDKPVKEPRERSRFFGLLTKSKRSKTPVPAPSTTPLDGGSIHKTDVAVRERDVASEVEVLNTQSLATISSSLQVAPIQDVPIQAQQKHDTRVVYSTPRPATDVVKYEPQPAPSQGRKPTKRLRPELYTIGWLCPMEIELAAALPMLDERHDRLQEQPIGDTNSYFLGNIKGHNVVIVGQNKTGNVPAAVTITKMKATFTRVEAILLVGIGGGVPTTPSPHCAFERVRLGDVVVGTPDNENPGAIQYDKGKAMHGKIIRTGYLREPPERLQSALNAFSMNRDYDLDEGLGDPLRENYLRLWNSAKPQWKKRFRFPGRENDLLFRADSWHKDCTPGEPPCHNCDRQAIIPQQFDSSVYPPDHGELQHDYITVHKGTIASGELVVKDAIQRDQLVKNSNVKNILCFETEAAGAVTGLPGLVIRGISDYCDSHKSPNDLWHGYAAATAAAYARQLLLYMAEGKEEFISTRVEEILQGHVEGAAMSALFKWLDQPHPLNPRNRHKFLQTERVQGTGASFIKLPKFGKWMNSGNKAPWNNRVLFCYGEPGAGKSYICSLVIDELERLSTTASVAYIYCDYRERPKQNIVAILGNLIGQLIPACEPSGQEFLLGWHKKHKSNGMKLEGLRFNAVLEVLRDLVSSHIKKQVFFCVDAVDECDESTLEAILDFIKTMAPILNVSFFVTGRSTVKDVVFRRVGTEVVSIRLAAEKEDIELYVNTRIDGDKWKDPTTMNADLRADILEKLVSNAKGIFLLPALQIASILEGYNIHRRRKLLEETSNSMSGTFKIMMERIAGQNPQRVALAIQTLQWLTLSKQNLSVADLQNALAVESGDHELNTENVTDIRFIVQSCLGLVVNDPMTGTVGLFHYSVQEFLQNDMDNYFPEGDAKIAEMCLTFINFPPFRSQTALELRPGLLTEAVENAPFLRYAAGFWGYHIQESNNLNENITQILLQSPLFASISTSDSSSQPTYTESFRAFDTTRNAARAPYFPYNIVHIAAFFGSVPILSYLLENSPNTANLFDAPDGAGSTPLIIAILHNHPEAVRFLLFEAQADPNTVDMSGQTPINQAIFKRNEQILRLLISSPRTHVNPAPLRKYGGIVIPGPLTTAAQKGWELAVRILIEEAQVDVDVKDGLRRRTPLGYAAHMGRIEVVRMLLSVERVDPDSRDSDGQTPLCNAAASSDDRTDVVESLLATKRVLVDAVDKDGLTPLGYAASLGHINTVDLLLKANADPNLKDGTGRSMLVYAINVAGDHWDIVNMLLESRGEQLEVDCKDEMGRTPLSYAVEREIEWWVGTLGVECFDEEVYSDSDMSFSDSSEEGADSEDGVPEAEARPAFASRKSIVKLLLDTGRVDANSKDIYGKTPIAYAIGVLDFKRFNGDKAGVPVVEFLLKAGAEM